MTVVDTTERLDELRKLMKQKKVDIYIVPSEDSHASEYIAPCDARREFISGFSGSAGTAVVTHDKAILSTDGRYFNQAAKQLDSNWELLKQGLENVPTVSEWLVERVAAAPGLVVTVDPSLVSCATAQHLSEKLVKAGGTGLTPLEGNIVDEVWGSGRPERPANPVVHLADVYSGRGLASKLEELRKDLEKRKSRGFVATLLDEVAWLLNLRGSDIPFNPVFFSYVVVTPDSATLYVDAAKLSPEVKEYLSQNHVTIKPYDAVFEEAKSLGSLAAEDAGAVDGGAASRRKFHISGRASWAIKTALGGESLVDEIRSPVGDAKALKNEVEVEGMRRCHIRDGAALIEYFAWLEDQLVVEKATLDEVDGAEKLEKLRSKQDKFMGLSFETISSTGANAAIIHYKAEKGDCSIIDPDAIYLCDSGGQYLDGTTDTTRTLHFGTPTEAEIHANTLVLKGHMALDMAVFPRGTTGFALDILARQFLWREGLDFRHGTGHGVGSFLNVHEGPVGVGASVHYAEVPFDTGHSTSIEPGFYEDGSYGIRIENISLVKKVETKFTFGDKPSLGFEHVTMVPLCRKLIDPSLLDAREKKWLDDYHAEIYEKTKGFFENDELTLAWLKRETQPIG